MLGYMLGYRLAYTLDCIMSYTYSITHWVTYCRSATLSDFPHLHELGHSMSTLCTISCLLSDQGLKIPKSDLFVYELKPVSVYRCTPAVISPSLDLLFIRISQNIARVQFKYCENECQRIVLCCTLLYCILLYYTVLYNTPILSCCVVNINQTWAVGQILVSAESFSYILVLAESDANSNY